MKYILTSSEMKQCDTNTMEKYGMLSAVLMERAALCAVEEIGREFSDPSARILLVCGNGNNGGDGLAMGRLLYLKGYSVTIVFPGKEEKCTLETKRQLEICRRYGIRILKEIPQESFDVIADAIFGIGLCREIGGIYAPLIEKMNSMQGWKVAVDISSGISADSGQVMGIAFRADLTVTFGFAKMGQLIYPGAAYTGCLVVKDIGIDEHSLFDINPKLSVFEKTDLCFLPQRRNHSNKGSYGKLLIFAGSENMAGAAAFSAKAAYRTGSGLVKVVTQDVNREIIQNLIPEAILAVWNKETDFSVFVKEQLDWADAVILGPGIGRSSEAEQLVKAVAHQVKVPWLADADALNILAEHRQWLTENTQSLIVTPHLGEMARLTGKTIPDIQNNIFTVASQFANEYDVITVLKDARTIISLPEGKGWINVTGNHGMATAGSGDVLTGMIGSLLGQGMDPQLAAPAGVMLHGMAGDEAAKITGKASLMASDLIDGIPVVLRQLKG